MRNAHINLEHYINQSSWLLKNTDEAKLCQPHLITAALTPLPSLMNYLRVL